jgi:glycosyltransferase involved in cell wall biosynthesis
VTPTDAAPPTVSVITIFLDAATYIDEAIASVMAQTLPDFELLLCDDGSTDGSSRIAQEWGGPATRRGSATWTTTDTRTGA